MVEKAELTLRAVSLHRVTAETFTGEQCFGESFRVFTNCPLNHWKVLEELLLLHVPWLREVNPSLMLLQTH